MLSMIKTQTVARGFQKIGKKSDRLSTVAFQVSVVGFIEKVVIFDTVCHCC